MASQTPGLPISHTAATPSSDSIKRTQRETREARGRLLRDRLSTLVRGGKPAQPGDIVEQMLAHESGAPQLVRQLDLDEAAAPAAVGAEDTSLPAQSPAAPTAHPPRQAPPASPPGAPSSSAGAQQVLSPTNGRQPGASRRESLGTSADKQAAAAAATTVRRRRTGVAFADPPASILRRPRPQEQQQEQRWAAGGEQPSQQLHGGVDVEELARRLEALGLATQRQQQQLEQRDAEIAQLREQLQQTAQVQAPQGAVRRRAARLQPPQLPGSLESPTDSEASDVVPAAGYRRTRRPVHLSSSDSSSEGGLDSEEDCDSAAPRLRQRPFRPSNLASRNGTTQPATAPDPRRQQQSGRTGAAAAPSGRQRGDSGRSAAVATQGPRPFRDASGWEEPPPAAADGEEDRSAFFARRCPVLPPGSRTPSALLMSNGELLHMPWDVVYAVVEDQNWQHALSVKVEPRGGTLGPLEVCEKPVQLDPEKEFWVSSESPNLSVLAALPTLGSQKPCLKPTRMALKLHLWQSILPSDHDDDSGMWGGGGQLAGRLRDCHTAALGGVEDAATEEVFAFEARYSSSAGGQQVMKVARISALAKWSARSALADGFSLYSFVDPLAATALYEVARIVVLARQGEEVWSQLEEQGKLQIQIFSVDFFGSTASGQHAVARRSQLLELHRPSSAAIDMLHDPDRQAAGKPCTSLKARRVNSPEAHVQWGAVQLMEGPAAPRLPAFAAADPVPSGSEARKKLAAKALLGRSKE